MVDSLAWFRLFGGFSLQAPVSRPGNAAIPFLELDRAEQVSKKFLGLQMDLRAHKRP